MGPSPASVADRLLMVAYHYPPAGFSSGVHRTLCFANDLLDQGWAPSVLTVTANAYPGTFAETRARIRPGVEVIPCPAFDSARALAIGGRYPRLAALPDRWASWLASGLVQGLRTIRRRRPRAIWSTYPIASAHLIGFWLHRLTGLPWIADFRDPMLDEHFPGHPWQRRCHGWIEARALRHASLAVFTTEATRRAFETRYPSGADFPAARAVIANGYDAELFAPAVDYRFDGGVVTLLHSGLLDPADRPPGPLLAALAELNREPGPPFRLRLRACGHDDQLRPLIAHSGLDEAAALLPPRSYPQAIAEMRRSDLLLLIQGASCPHQVPAKLYEYLRAGRPILGLCDPDSETARVLREAGVETLASPEDRQGIRAALAALRQALLTGRARGVDPALAERYDRRHRSAELALLLEPYKAGG